MSWLHGWSVCTAQLSSSPLTGGPCRCGGTSQAALRAAYAPRGGAPTMLPCAAAAQRKVGARAASAAAGRGGGGGAARRGAGQRQTQQRQQQAAQEGGGEVLPGGAERGGRNGRAHRADARRKELGAAARGEGEAAGGVHGAACLTVLGAGRAARRAAGRRHIPLLRGRLRVPRRARRARADAAGGDGRARLHHLAAEHRAAGLVAHRGAERQVRRAHAQRGVVQRGRGGGGEAYHQQRQPGGGRAGAVGLPPAAHKGAERVGQRRAAGHAQHHGALLRQAARGRLLRVGGGGRLAQGAGRPHAR
mmetsp:Transcript_7825/g.23962  ORF Transcript_7825/g.23962 Transcript_7825/m.23962 type:complete len:305 (+) Transcript_7825:822-1736(+)